MISAGFPPPVTKRSKFTRDEHPTVEGAFSPASIAYVSYTVLGKNAKSFSLPDLCQEAAGALLSRQWRENLRALLR